MSVLITLLFVVQILLGAYMYSFVLGAGQMGSNARATRIPDPVAFVHPVGAGLTLVSWFIHLGTGADGFVWVTFTLLLLTASAGLVMALVTLRGKRLVDRPAAHQVVLVPGSPAEIRVAEKQIPPLALALHGLGFAALLCTTLLVALGVAE